MPDQNKDEQNPEDEAKEELTDLISIFREEIDPSQWEESAEGSLSSDAKGAEAEQPVGVEKAEAEGGDNDPDEPSEIPSESLAPVKKSRVQVKETRWSHLNSGVASIDPVSDYSELIFSRTANFEIDDLHFDLKNEPLRTVDLDRFLPQSEKIPLDPVPEPLAEEISESKAERIIALFEKLRTGEFFTRDPLSEVEEYDQAVHGPLVDLRMPEEEGIEEIELYPVNEPYAYIRIIYDNISHEYRYIVIEPVLTDIECELENEIKERLFETLDINTTDLTRQAAEDILRRSVYEIIQDYGITLTPVSRQKIVYNIHRSFLGDGLIDAVMHDKYIEDISCDGLDTPIFVYHSNYESLKSNLVYSETSELDSFVTKLAQRAGKYISIAEPMLDATMEDGSRIQMTLSNEVTAHGSTFTIRKFKDEPITPTDLIEWGTFSPLSVAYIWLAVENGQSCIFAGGTASGKTTSLNAISLFIPPLAKIVTLEDTRELKLPHQNWIPSVTRESFDANGKGSIDMYELLRAALRQRPEYILVGEVRGQEALTLFQAMSTGHITYATMHADSVASVVHRLENPPLNVPRNMLNALDLVSVQVQARIGGQRIRRNKQLIEILDIDPRTNELITNEVFKWHQATDEIRYSGKSYILEKVMEERGWDEVRMREELKRRQEILEWMRIKKLRYYKDVSKVLVSYYRDPETLMDLVRKDLYE